MIERDEVITLPSGTEISVEAAVGDINRALNYWNDVEDEDGEALACDLQHVAELIKLLARRAIGPVYEDGESW